MYIPSLSILTTLACAAYSIAIPTTYLPKKRSLDPLSELANALGARGGADIVRRDDVPTVPATPTPTTSSPLVDALTELVVALRPAVDDVVKCVDVAVDVHIDSEKVKSSIQAVGVVISSHLDHIKTAASQTVNVELAQVADLLSQVVLLAFTALGIVQHVGAVASDVLNPLAGMIIGLVGEVLSTVASVVPDVASLVVESIRPVYQDIMALNGQSLFAALGVPTPF